MERERSTERESERKTQRHKESARQREKKLTIGTQTREGNAGSAVTRSWARSAAFSRRQDTYVSS